MTDPTGIVATGPFEYVRAVEALASDANARLENLREKLALERNPLFGGTSFGQR